MLIGQWWIHYFCWSWSFNDFFPLILYIVIFICARTFCIILSYLKLLKRENGLYVEISLFHYKYMHMDKEDSTRHIHSLAQHMKNKLLWSFVKLLSLLLWNLLIDCFNFNFTDYNRLDYIQLISWSFVWDERKSLK